MPTTVIRAPRIFRPCDGPVIYTKLYEIQRYFFILYEKSGLLHSCKMINIQVINKVGQKANLLRMAAKNTSVE